MISGPLLYKDKETNTTVVAGIVSWGFDCATPGKPGFYARVNQVLPWITETIQKKSKCTGETITDDHHSRHDDSKGDATNLHKYLHIISWLSILPNTLGLVGIVFSVCLQYCVLWGCE